MRKTPEQIAQFEAIRKEENDKNRKQFLHNWQWLIDQLRIVITDDCKFSSDSTIEYFYNSLYPAIFTNLNYHYVNIHNDDTCATYYNTKTKILITSIAVSGGYLNFCHYDNLDLHCKNRIDSYMH